MIKLASSRDAILKSGLKIKPDKLLTFAEKGTVESWDGDQNAGFLVKYTIHQIVTDYQGALQDLLFVACQWVKAECKSSPTDALGFHVDQIDSKTYDVSLSIEVEEHIAVTVDGKNAKTAPKKDAKVEDLTALILYGENG
jgi:hypothetical protein